MPRLKLSNGVLLSYFSFPDPLPSPTRPTILLLSAFFQRVDVQFIPQVQDTNLTGNGQAFNFIGIDVHGHGETSGREEWGYMDNAKDVADGLSLLGVDKFFIMAASHGGITAQELSLLCPSRVRGIILIGSTCRPYSSQFRTHMRDVFVPVWSSSDPPPDSALARSIQSTLGAPPKRPEELGSVFGDRAPIDHQPHGTRTAESAVGIELLSKIVDNWRTHTGEMKLHKPVDVLLGWEGCEARLRSVATPVLIIHGEDDSTILFECAEHILSALPDNKLTRVVKMNGKGAHLVNEVAEVAIELNEMVKSWLDECIQATIHKRQRQRLFVERYERRSPQPRTGLPPVAKYVCGAAFVLSMSLAIPFFYAKSRALGPKVGVHISRNAALGPGAALLGRSPRLSSQLSHSTRKVGQMTRDEPPADTLGAIRHAFKALGVATLAVGATTGVGVVGVMVGLGSPPYVGEFHTLMRSLVHSSFPELHATLHSVPNTAAQGRVEVWDKEQVEKALEEAYAKGGVRAWMSEARRQLERERAAAQRVAEWQGQNRSG
ncbi:hypothetical protein RSOLAG22IIIB_06751 [Rhizoctonia solani]|uniref:Serine aminopeptidase S33 domain-containing protein n=1 Tax=Rhizoctonia solani TaxID=456999 RepID=A0A0K6GGV4_9AGAM|nr:hypothetical protein RSOLAG22IIIB_06751 [Rhizoctonia solani]